MKRVFASFALISMLSVADYALAEHEAYSPGYWSEEVAAVNAPGRNLSANGEDGSEVEIRKNSPESERLYAGTFELNFFETMLIYNNPY